MQNLFYVSAVFEAAIIIACFIFIVLLVSTKLLPKEVNRYGVLLFSNIVFIAGFYLLINTNQIQFAKPLIWLFVPSTITVSLFFYLFNTVWLEQNLRLDRYLKALPILVLLLFIALEFFSYLYPGNEALKSWRIWLTANTMRYLFTAYTGLLLILNLYKIRLAESSNEEAYAEDFIVNLNWCRLSLAFYFLFYIGMILSEVSSPWISEFIFNISILTLTLYLGYYQINVIARYLENTNQKEGSNDDLDPEPEHDEKGKPPQSDANDERLQSIFELVDNMVNQEQLFLKSSLTIHELGIRLGLNSKYLSQAINHQGDLNFNKYINQKRIVHSKKIILDENYDNYSLEGIAKESGFGSKSTFNTTFKAIEGITPSAYRKMHRN